MSIPPTDPYVPRRARDSALLREVGAVLLILIGAVGFVGAMFLWCEPAGLAAASAVSIAAGAFLGYDR